jgi:2-polyprenyl-3-methyl-5-hydroxy-6-metoxy-1,4-benzoquinol methylase
MPTASRFWDRIADRYARKPVPDEAVYQKKLQLTRAHLRPDMRVLEFGCGSGITALSHAPYVASIHGIDSSARMVEIARAKATEAGTSNATFTRSSFEEFDAAPGSFDVVLGLSVLHLVDDLRSTIGKAHRLLKPNGLLITSTPCLDGGYRILKLVLPLASRFGLVPSVQFFSAHELLESQKSAGFSILNDWRPSDGRTVFVIASKK